LAPPYGLGTQDKPAPDTDPALDGDVLADPVRGLACESEQGAIMRARRLACSATLLVSLTLLACACDPRAGRPELASKPVELTGSLEPLRAHFNAQSNLPRAIVLLSPT
jgi:hypothetical protein